MDDRELLEAIRDSQVVQIGTGVQGRTYALHGDPITYMELRRLAKLDLIDLPLGGSPSLAPAGVSWLRDGARGHSQS